MCGGWYNKSSSLDVHTFILLCPAHLLFNVRNLNEDTHLGVRMRFASILSQQSDFEKTTTAAQVTTLHRSQIKQENSEP